MCDPVTTSHMLYWDKCPIQYSGAIYVSPRKQSVLTQLFCSTLWRNSYKNEAVLTACVVLPPCPLLTWPIIILPPLQNGYQFGTQKFNITCCRHHLCKMSYRCIRTYILPTMTSSTTSCISVICERNNCTNTLCSSGDTLGMKLGGGCSTPIYNLSHNQRRELLGRFTELSLLKVGVS